jgi:argonaute-like protein implicated in RNA metabolism and viral defense
MTIYEIKNRVTNAPYFFTRKSMKFFNQTLKDFSVIKLENGNFYLSAPMYDRNYKIVGTTKREFNPKTNEFL